MEKDYANDEARSISERDEERSLAAASELGLRHVEHDSILDLCPISFVRKKNKFRLRIDKIF